MDMPSSGPEQARLARFAGHWQGRERVAPSPFGPGGDAEGHFDFRPALDGMAVVQDYEETMAGRVAFRGHGIFLVDPAGTDVLWWWFDSFAYPADPPARGRWDGHLLSLEKTTPRGTTRYRYTLAGDRFQLQIASRFAGQDAFVEFLSGDYTRLR